MAKGNDNIFQKFLSILRRTASKQSGPEVDKRKFIEHNKESALRSAKPPADEGTKELHKDDNKPEQ